MKNNSKKYARGFTIAEVVVVIGIMAIITSVVLTSLIGSKKQARDQKRVAEIKSVQLALEQFYARNKYYPNSLDLSTQTELKRYLAETPVEAKYAPLNDIGPSSIPNTMCGSYHLYITLESKISVLDSKKSFDSTLAENCISTAPTIDAGLAGNELIYDVTP